MAAERLLSPKTQEEFNRVVGERLRKERLRAIRAELLRLQIIRSCVVEICDASERALDAFSHLEEQLAQREIALAITQFTDDDKEKR
jgi:hypothetical protein